MHSRKGDRNGYDRRFTPGGYSGHSVQPWKPVARVQAIVPWERRQPANQRGLSLLPMQSAYIRLWN
jgi:hypothetical protein